MLYVDHTKGSTKIGMQFRNKNLTYLHWSKNKPTIGIGLFWPKDFNFTISSLGKGYTPIGSTILVEWEE